MLRSIGVRSMRATAVRSIRPRSFADNAPEDSPKPFDFSSVYTEAKINFLKEDADFPEWLGDVTAGKPDLREMTLEEHGKSYSKLKRKGGIKSKNLVKEF
eukprot:TRINITY_DN1872_c0_g1_i1.p1 TRINITY_DN1872_c0_g1~~TRINITY_DN1872_c0_g1_i1.p1  ORF type:complete len:100 (-),score=18.74 TRINITY_DN1872_c0_g1_i1:1-300(-)